MGKANKGWHAKNGMPKNLTRSERIKWHSEHAKNCACREIPHDLAEEIDKFGYEKSNSAYDRAKAAGIIGSINAPSDLSTNVQHFRNIGRKR